MARSTAPSDDRSTPTYLRVRPTDSSPPTDRIVAQVEQLHGTLTDQAVEVRLESVGDEVALYYGTTGRATRSLDRILRTIYPDDYTIEDQDPDLSVRDADDHVAAEFRGVGERHDDWQTRLRPPLVTDAPAQHETARLKDAPGLPLSGIVEGMAGADASVVYQALLTPRLPWGVEAECRIRDLEENRDTFAQRAFEFLFGDVTADYDTDRSSSRTSRRTENEAHRRGDVASRPGSRIDAILAKSTDRCFDVNARIVATGPDAEATVRDLASTFEAIGGDYYDVRPAIRTGEAATALAEAVVDRTFRDGDALPERLKRKLPFTANASPCVVADTTTVGHFCLLDAADPTQPARRALRSVPAERTGVRQPDAAVLEHYTDAGLPLGYPVDADGSAADQPIAVPPDLQPLHVAWFGKTGSGKTTSLVNAILRNVGATDGADVVVAPKGDGMPREYLRGHYARYGDLEDVYYFDCSETLPAIPFFDVREELRAGVSRTTAVEDVVDHYVAILRAIMDAERFDRAVRSPDVIRYLLKALFDREHGNDAFSHRAFQSAVRRFRHQETPPRVSDPDLRSMLGGLAANTDRTFDEVMQGVANRIEKIPLDDRLATVFNHVPADDDPHFDLRTLLDEDAVVILDTGGLRPESQRALALVLLSQLWTALRRRRRDATGDVPLVNLYLEEAASVASSDLVSELLAQSRGFGLSVTLAMQFPAQLAQADEAAYGEVLNNVSTVVAGNVAVDKDLATRFATDAMPPEDVGNRLRSLGRGQWFVDLPAPFDHAEPRPFVAESLDLPPGHPDGPEPLSPAGETGFEALLEVATERTRTEAGLDVDGQAADTTVSATDDEDQPGTIDSALPFTARLPRSVRYDAARHALVCRDCDTAYPPTADGMRDAIDCDDDLAGVDRDNIPICECNVLLDPDDIAASPYTRRQLAFLRTVFDAHQRRFDPEIEYDLLRDSMARLKEYVGIDDEAVEELVDDGLLRHDTDHPHRLYTVTGDGREAIGTQHSAGVTYGPDAGDLGESSHHVLMVEAGRQYLEQAYVDDPACDVVRAVSYHEPEGHDHRLDAAGLDADGEVAVALEAERVGNDIRRAAPADFDKLAAHDPDEAIWIVGSREAMHDVLEALNAPTRGAPRIDKEYSRNTSPPLAVEEPGWTEVRMVTPLLDEVVE